MSNSGLEFCRTSEALFVVFDTRKQGMISSEARNWKRVRRVSELNYLFKYYDVRIWLCHYSQCMYDMREEISLK